MAPSDSPFMQFHRAFLHRDLGALQRAIEAGCPPDTLTHTGHTALQMACFQNWPGAIALLHRAGARADAPSRCPLTLFELAAPHGIGLLFFLVSLGFEGTDGGADRLPESERAPWRAWTLQHALQNTLVHVPSTTPSRARL